VHIVLDEVSRLIDLGHQEIVLAGIFLGAYGHESALRRKQRQLEADPLADLVSAVATLPGLRRLRLSSLEPGDVTDELLDVYATHPKVLAPHLHLPLQSGSDEVLRRMNRQYRVGEYLELIDRVTATLTRNTLPPAITTDIICGFPGETDEAFQQTVEIVQRVGFLHMHVFPWSPRHGTAAARWLQDAAASPVVTKRVRDLMQMENAAEIGLAVAFRSRLIGREVRLFAEQPDPNRPGHWLGRCDHYALISVESDCKRGEFVRAIARRIEDDAIVADVVASRSLPVLNSN
jgi:threonylcarbamoyladenosine tRNA methylthiotransferase MtaB